jgi:hypothetical protein
MKRNLRAAVVSTLTLAVAVTYFRWVFYCVPFQFRKDVHVPAAYYLRLRWSEYRDERTRNGW